MAARAESRLGLGAVRRLAGSRWGLLFALTATAGVVFRLWMHRSTIGTPNSDEAVVGLMAIHALDGELTTFFWGQEYGGPQEVLLTVPVFLVAGSGWLTLRLVPFVLTAVASLVLWRVGRRTIGEPAAAVAAALFWIWPSLNMLRLTQQQGFYASNVLYCGLLLLLALRVVERPDRLRVGTFGLVLGLAFWQTPQIVPIAVPIVAWTIWKAPGALRHVWVALPLAALGSLPWLVWNAGHDWESLVIPDYGDDTYRRSLRLLVSPVLPMVAGLRAPFSAELLLPAPLTYAIYVALVALFGYAAWRSRRRDVSLLYLVAAAFPFLYAISPKTLSGEPRYLVVLTPVLALLVAQVATTYARAVAVLALACVISVVTLHRMDEWFRNVPPITEKNWLGPRQTIQSVPRDLGPLISTLDGLGLDRVYANYWISYRLAFETGERIVAVENDFEDVRFASGRAIPSPHPDVRYPPYQREVDDAARSGFVFYRKAPEPPPIVAELESHGYRPHVVGTFIVYAPGGAP